MVVFKMRESVPTARYSPVCNVLRQWKTSLILTYRVYRLYDNKNNYKFRGKKGKRRACIEPGTVTTQNHYSNTMLTYRTERNEEIVHYISDTCNTYATISILGRSG